MQTPCVLEHSRCIAQHQTNAGRRKHLPAWLFRSWLLPGQAQGRTVTINCSEHRHFLTAMTAPNKHAQLLFTLKAGEDGDTKQSCETAAMVLSDDARKCGLRVCGLRVSWVGGVTEEREGASQAGWSWGQCSCIGAWAWFHWHALQHQRGTTSLWCKVWMRCCVPRHCELCRGPHPLVVAALTARCHMLNLSRHREVGGYADGNVP